MLNINTLSGYEGVGKSTIIKHYQEERGFIIIPETARLIMPLEKTIFKDSKDDLSYKSFTSYLTNIHFMLSNKMNINVISDRNIVDSLTYLRLYSKDQNINIIETGDFIEQLNEEYERDYLYNETILIKHPIDNVHIIDNILSDPERIYGKNVEQYKIDAANWEDIYCNITNYLNTRGLSKKLNIIESYPSNKNIIINTENIIIK